MKNSIFIAVLLLMMCSYGAFAGEKVDRDGDGFQCVIEDDGTYCNEDDQDRCDGIPNISLNDDHCSMDYNDDGLFTIADIRIIQTQRDHFITGIAYPDYQELEVPINFGGYVCYDLMRVIEYNKRLVAAGLPLLQRDQPFAFTSRPPHCGTDHHSYPPIPISIPGDDDD